LNLAADSGRDTVEYRAYAKLNFYLAVIDRRPDGYHDIETIFQSVSLNDTVRLTSLNAELTLTCNNTELESDDNLALCAAQILGERFSPGRGVHIELTKCIPVAAGLAGGSADAAAVLAGLNELWELNLEDAVLYALAGELGSDVPFALKGGTAAGTGRGDALQPLEPLRETWLVLVHPPIEVSAARVYNHLMLTKSHEERIEGMTSTFRNVLETLSRGLLPDVLQNSMESAVFSEFPELAVLKQRLLDAGCAGAAMSGSGPTLYGLCRDEAHAHAISEEFPDWPTSVVKTVPQGVERIG
jgi:4-diphosphocytidyl-2-C-methyl-D-erythritol kinase